MTFGTRPMKSEQQLLQQFFETTVGTQSAHGIWGVAGSLSVEEAFAVYQKGYIARLTEALGETYETIWKFLGDDSFFETAKKFIQANPSLDPNLSNYGRHFPLFLAKQESFSDYGYLQDLAFLDWTRSWLFHQRTQQGITADILAQKLNNRSVVRLVESVVWIKSAFPLFSLWKAIHQELDPPDFSGNENVLLFKKNDQVYLLPVSNGILEILENLRQGKNLEQAIDSGSEEDIFHVIELLKENHWIYALSDS